MKRLCALFLAAALLGSSCSVVQQVLPGPDHTLRLVEPVVYTMEACFGKKSVTMQVVPGKEAALAADILQLESIEREAMRELRAEGGFSAPLSIPGYDYELCCTMREGEGKAEKCCFTVRRGTLIGRSTDYCFDARDYFTPASWEEVRRELYDEDYDGDMDERFFKHYRYTPLPPREGEGAAAPAES